MNLDLTFNYFDESDVETLKTWENVCPNITYRIVLWPDKVLKSIYGQTVNATEIKLRYEQNETLDGWKGFCYDIEGINFQYNTSFDSFEEAI